MATLVPDLNPIENVWSMLDRSVRKRQGEIKNKAGLWEVLQDEWYKIDKKYIQKLYLGYGRRIAALKKSKFDATGY